MAEYKLLFAGPMGAGKTTAIRAISDAAPVDTEVANNDRERSNKASTTVGLDYGETCLEGGYRLRLFGLPGQERFDFMWKIVANGAFGVILLLDHSQADALRMLDEFVDRFDGFARQGALVVGVGRAENEPTALAGYAEQLARRQPPLPAFAVDVRRREDVLLLLEALLAQIEASEGAG